MTKAKFKPFTQEQLYYLAQGKIRSEQLTANVYYGLGIDTKIVSPKRHTYITSGPGAGKTYTVNAAIEKKKLKVVKIQGSASMNAVVIQLAVALYLKPKGDVIVWIDDCDSIFIDRESLSVMKGALDEDRNVLAWNKNLTNQINIYLNSPGPNDKIKGEALKSFQPVGSVGVELPTDRVRFIITSNKRLKYPSEANPNRITEVNESAINDRVNYFPFDLEWKESWGWMAYNVLQAKSIGTVVALDLEQKTILLDWMWANWSRLGSTSMRGVQELGADMINKPRDYPTHWDNRLLRKKTGQV
jgi:hypothetical protein